MTIPWNKGLKTGIYKECSICLKEYYVKPSRKNSKYCCLSCCFDDKEFLRSLGEKKLGNHLTDKHKKSISDALKIKAKRGADHPFYKDGKSDIRKAIRKSFDYKNWREQIFERDNYECQICFERGGELHPNHIKRFADYPSIRFDLCNGITLCKECHVGLVNRHEEDWEDYFNYCLIIIKVFKGPMTI